MQTDVPFLSRFLSKVLEVIGAGLASAAGAFLLGHIAAPAAPPPVVQIVPANADTVRMVRGTAGAVPATASVRIDKGSKSAKTSPAHREHKAQSMRTESTHPESTHPESTHPDTDAAARGPQMPVRITPAKSAAEQSTQGGEAVDLAPPLAASPAQATGDGGFRLFAALRQIPAWFRPDAERTPSGMPRPPLAVGQFWQSTM